MYFVDPDGMQAEHNPFKGLVKAVRETVVSDLKAARRSLVNNFNKLDNAIRKNGVMFWVDNNDLKKDGLVQPDKPNDRFKVVTADASAVDAVTTVAGTNADPRGKTLKERTEGVSAVGEKADEISKQTGGSDYSTVKTNTIDESKTNRLTIINFAQTKDGELVQTGSSTTTKRVSEQQSKIDSAKAKSSTNYVIINRPDEKKK